MSELDIAMKKLTEDVTITGMSQVLDSLHDALVDTNMHADDRKGEVEDGKYN